MQSQCWICPQCFDDKHHIPGDENCTKRTKRPYATKTKRRTYTVTDEVHAELQRIGWGNASAGIREAVKRASQ